MQCKSGYERVGRYGAKCGNCMLECNSNSQHIAQSGNQNERYTGVLETTLNFNCIFYISIHATYSLFHIEVTAS